MNRRVVLMVATTSALVLSSMLRLFFVHVVDHDGGVESIALRLTPGWKVEDHLPSETFRTHGYIVLIRGNENGVAGEDLLHANSYAVWVLLVVGAMLALGKAENDEVDADGRRSRDVDGPPP